MDLGPLRPSLPHRLKTRDRRVRVSPPRLVAATERAAAELLERPSSDELLLGRRHLRSNNSWIHNLPRLVDGRPRHHLPMHPDDLSERCLADGQLVRVASRAGAVEVKVRATSEVMPGVVSLP